MGELLGALVAVPLSRKLRIVGPYKNMAWLISAVDSSSSSFLRTVFLLRQIDWAITQSKQLFAYLTVVLSPQQMIW
jgi:hypothetical protein